MPQDVLNNYQYPLGTPGIAGQTIESEAYNTFLDDLVINDLNIPRPIHRGGTGATTPAEAIANIKGESSDQVVTNYDSHLFLPGSFRSASSATGAPINGHAFAGIAYLHEPLATPLTNQNLVIEARDYNDTTAAPGRLYVREKRFGVWSAWVEQVGGAVEAVALFDARYVNQTGDTMTGGLVISSGNFSVAGAGGVGGVLTVTGAANLNGGMSTPLDIYASGNMTCTNFYCASPGNHWTTSSGGSLTVAYEGYKPGGGSWAASSDARIKTVLGDYTHGLAEIKQLMPRRYSYNGNDLMLGTDDVTKTNPKVDDPGVSSHGMVLNKEFIGLVAQECETFMPEMVTLTSGVIDGQAVDDMRVLNASALTFALVNAIKELAARVEQLEAAT